MATSAPIIIASQDNSTPRTRQPHWDNDKGTKFHNPWPSYQGLGGFSSITKTIYQMATNEKDESGEALSALVPNIKPTWGEGLDTTKLKYTWLGHAAGMVELPAAFAQDGDEKRQTRGVRVLLDPAFSNRCSPIQSYGGAARVQPLLFELEDLPEFDVILISHNHYDHQDNNTLEALYKLHAKRPPLIIVPLNNARGLPSNIPKQSIIELDWWEHRIIGVEGVGQAQITCTPSQHQSARGIHDRMWSLWSSWAIKHVPSSPNDPAPSVFFGGDTGYCHRDNPPDDPVGPPAANEPVCPAFAEIGEKLGPFTLGLIPIGAYRPKMSMSSMHCDPYEAVGIYKDTRCKQAIGIHWGVWRMIVDKVHEPVGKLAEARKLAGLNERDFGVCAVGETRAFDT